MKRGFENRPSRPPTFHSPQHSLTLSDLYDLRTININISSAFHRYQNLKMVTCDSLCGGGSHILYLGTYIPQLPVLEIYHQGCKEQEKSFIKHTLYLDTNTPQLPFWKCINRAVKSRGTHIDQRQKSLRTLHSVRPRDFLSRVVKSEGSHIDYERHCTCLHSTTSVP